MYTIYALIGKAGSGKDTILKKAIEKEPIMFNEIISSTTRPPREGEVNGIHYNFYDEEEFTQRTIEGNFLEITWFREWFYGTEYESLRSDVINLGVFNPSGIESLRIIGEEKVNLTVFYVDVEDKTRLLRQINREQNPDCFEIMRRYRADEIDFEHLNFDFVKLNNENEEDLKEAVETICRYAKDKKD